MPTSAYDQYAGYGNLGYHAGLDDPTVLPTEYATPPADQTPEWALPAALTAGGVLGIFGLGRLGKHLSRRALQKGAKPASAIPVTKIPPMQPAPFHGMPNSPVVKMSSQVVRALGHLARSA